MPMLWWAEYCRNANGYFGSTATTNREGNPTGINTWTRFLVKLLHGPAEYKWYKINIFVQWLPTSQQTVILLFDAPSSLQKLLPSPFLDGLSRDDLVDPFWIYPRLIEEVVRHQDAAVWAARTQVRTVEKARALVDHPGHDFAQLHDLARHMIHISETLDVSVKTISGILRGHQASSMNTTGVTQPPHRIASQAIHERLIFLENMLENLRHRSISNKQRLDNEVQLAFHMVTQYDATLSLKLNQSMQSDSSAMKTISLLGLTFLPATFISAIFSMSFFTNDAEAGWTMSSRIWIYWAFAIPVTLLTTGLWFSFQRGWLGSR
ncbi:uncharacterized protein DNG_07908 [Cephalotrichum gorgonifer]|uniref:CorA domain-containing protein n=1 Tax=Cephalotrichum gorgonifer TaxID=2041049 RepID=A0AAE8SXV8_9PEZI|nr:uncharacterized protein DNG_07908 [Cephalotrichum gorgonifer]